MAAPPSPPSPRAPAHKAARRRAARPPAHGSRGPEPTHAVRQSRPEHAARPGRCAIRYLPRGVPAPFGAAKASCVPHLEIAGLRRRQRLEQSAVGLEIDERRAVEAIEPAHEQNRSLDPHELHDRRADGIGTDRRTQREYAACRAIVFWALARQIASRFVEPVEHLQTLECFDAAEPELPRRAELKAARRPVGSALSRTVETRGPGRADAADEED